MSLKRPGFEGRQLRSLGRAPDPPSTHSCVAEQGLMGRGCWLEQAVAPRLHPPELLTLLFVQADSKHLVCSCYNIAPASHPPSPGPRLSSTPPCLRQPSPLPLISPAPPAYGLPGAPPPTPTTTSTNPAVSINTTYAAINVKIVPSIHPLSLPACWGVGVGMGVGEERSSGNH